MYITSGLLLERHDHAAVARFWPVSTARVDALQRPKLFGILSSS